MTKKQIIAFINKNPMFSLATIDGDRPRVRNMMTAFADERGIIFTTGKSKDVYNQIKANNSVELCYFSQAEEIQIRIEAVAMENDDIELKKAIVEKFQFLKPWVDQAGYDVLGTFILDNARACIWTMATNAEPKVYIDL